MPKLLLANNLADRNSSDGEALDRVGRVAQALATASPSNALCLNVDRVFYQIRLRFHLRSQPSSRGEAG